MSLVRDCPNPQFASEYVIRLRTCTTIAILICILGTGNTAAAGKDGWFEVTSDAMPGSSDSQANGSPSPIAEPVETPLSAATMDGQSISELLWREASGGQGAEGDGLWQSVPGDTFSGIAYGLTGNAGHAGQIAQYNRMRLDAPLPAGTAIRIPQELLSVQDDVGQRAPVNGRAGLRTSAMQDARPDSREGSSLPAANARTNDYSGLDDDGRTDELFLTDDDARIAERQKRRNRIPGSSVKTLNVDMFAGEVNVMGRVDVSRVAIGNGDIVRAEVLKNGELLVIAQAEGSTSLRLWHRDDTQSDYNIRVSAADPETRVRMETMVRMRVRMIEFRKSALGKLGIDWSDSAAGPGFAIAGDALGNNLFRPAGEAFATGLPNTVKPFSTYFGVTSNITSRINFLTSTGDATTLAEPVLSTTSGGNASFLAGGEVPYPSVGANGQTIVQFKEYGIKLNVSPSIDASGNVRTRVETEISQLDPAVSVQGAPGLLTRKAQTQVNVRSGETIVISGLLSSESSKDIDSLPGIGKLPVIGSFFRARNTRKAVSELVIFVTPEIVEPATAYLDTRQHQFLQSSERRIDEAHQQIRLLD
ncbi:MAG: hypothetical protein HKN42_06935 [Granulosicoccus sp.]|nr:hypothetical protein [Granulosicoccus sp.]